MLFKLSSDDNSGKVNIFLDTKTYVRWWDNSQDSKANFFHLKIIVAVIIGILSSLKKSQLT